MFDIECATRMRGSLGAKKSPLNPRGHIRTFNEIIHYHHTMNDFTHDNHHIRKTT